MPSDPAHAATSDLVGARPQSPAALHRPDLQRHPAESRPKRSGLRGRRDLGLVAWAGMLVIGIRLSLRVLPIQTLRRLLRPWLVVRLPARAPWPVARDEVQGAVGTAARLTPHGRCLAQALTAQILLAHRGHATRLRIGALRPAPTSEPPILCHAWLERGREIVVGACAASPTFEPIPISLINPGTIRIPRIPRIPRNSKRGSP